MPKKRRSDRPFVIGGKSVRPGQSRDVALNVSETYTGSPVTVPVRVIRAPRAGPIVFVTGAIHGDELIGVGIIRELMMKDLPLHRGILLCVPVANIFGFDSHSRYLPDRRDLNRSFPGNRTGSLASRLGHVIFKEIVVRCDYGIDLHTAAVRRTNFPQVRADLSVPGIRDVAMAFGCELIVDKRGHPGSLRSVASERGCPTILYEAGEVLKFEPGTIKLGVRGVLNVLRHLGMLSGEIEEPAYQTVTERTTWIRSDTGGLLRFHVKPGDPVQKGESLATVEKLFSSQTQTVEAPMDSLVVGMTTLPAVKPGEPVCHLAVPSLPIEEIRRKMSAQTLHRRVQTQLGSSFRISKVEP